MLSLSPALAAVFVGLASGVVIYLLFGVRGRRQAESHAGVDVLAAMKWREFAHLVLEALRRQGYVEQDVERQPGDSGFDFVLGRDGQRYLLACKQGRAYRLGEQAVREFATAIRMQGAMGGVLVTLGQVEGFAREVATAHRIELIDGETLWQRVAPLLPQELRRGVHKQAESGSNRRLALGALGSVALALTVFTLMEPEREPPLAAASIVSDRPLQQAPPVRPGSSAAELPPLPKLSEAEFAERRVAAAQLVGKLPNIDSASWSTRSTLVIALRDTRDGRAADPVEESCRILVQYEELRFTRLQIEPPPGDDAPVRWRQCR
ncbi:MAG: restriction endonuclease [Rehaibacterium terrae]|uniref:restriction endonuclease n=1 Tax=Rehaibacterium terrae TaxID=1341696 RepID=UPI00391C8A4D